MERKSLQFGSTVILRHFFCKFYDVNVFFWYAASAHRHFSDAKCADFRGSGNAVDLRPHTESFQSAHLCCAVCLPAGVAGVRTNRQRGRRTSAVNGQPSTLSGKHLYVLISPQREARLRRKYRQITCKTDREQKKICECIANYLHTVSCFGTRYSCRSRI